LHSPGIQVLEHLQSRPPKASLKQCPIERLGAAAACCRIWGVSLPSHAPETRPIFFRVLEKNIQMNISDDHNNVSKLKVYKWTDHNNVLKLKVYKQQIIK
jgi:hypothetical protein